MDIEAKKIFWGESIGCAVITSYLALHCPVSLFPEKVVFAAPFFSLKETVHHMVPFPFSGLIASTVKEFDTEKNIEKLHQRNEIPNNIHFLILHSRNDEIIPFFQGKAVFAQLQKHDFDAEFSECEGGHNQMRFQTHAIIKFLKK